MMKNAFILNFFRLYNMLWALALPVLKKNRRLSPGFSKRVGSRHHDRTDLWIQAASAGEAYLAVQIIKNLVPDRPVKILVTTITSQGKDILERHLTPDQTGSNLRINIEWTPFDIPGVIKKAVRRIRPRVMVLLETEIWPAMLYYLKQQNTKIFIINARLSKKSFQLYKKTSFLWNRLCPDEILATSERDAHRYARIFKKSRVTTMSNIKFDIMAPGSKKKDGPEFFKSILPEKIPVTVLASVRKPEENKIEILIEKLLTVHPDQILFLFPRHMHRIRTWKKRLTRMKLPFLLRSSVDGPIKAPCVILWDIFGELRSAYELGQAVFVGGSLEPLGGQNFIEPAILGIPTVIGPYYHDFEWASPGIFTTGLVEKRNTIDEIVQVLAYHLTLKTDRKKRLELTAGYLHAHSGGTLSACRIILDALL